MGAKFETLYTLIEEKSQETKWTKLTKLLIIYQLKNRKKFN